MINKIKKRVTKRPHEEPLSQDSAPRITNETVAEHREEVLSSARKYIYPLQHSKHKIVLITTSLLIAVIVGFFTFTMVSLYRVKSYSSFLYGVTKVIPFPVAKAGNSYVAYENYLFELKHYIHYYQNQQKLDFSTDSGKQQLAEFKKRALTKVVDDAYIKQLAAEKKVTVSDKEVDNEIQIVRSQNRLGGSTKVFEDVLKEYYGWSINDFRRSLKQQLLAQKLLPVLDPETVTRANQAKAELNAGADFAAVAKKYSDDAASKDTGGEFGFPIDQSNRDIDAQVTNELYKLKPGQVSGVINSGYALEIVKNIEPQGDKIRGAHIVFNFKNINMYLNDLKDQKKATLYIKL
ncbi:MAG: SurA N-terminal domain-containing protein [Candidatus Saccharibacteria bacterium]|nr:SurA N-terminal domain-containing protein [Candidatus Saccharibacteria bacterium]